MKADVTYGTFDSGNCYPFMCNDSGTATGQSIDYMQTYGASGFSAPATISGITWYLDAADSGANTNFLGGSYTFSWGYAAFGSVGNLSSTLASNYLFGPNFLGTATVSAFAQSASVSLNGISFDYDPTIGDLLLEISVSNQDNVPNGQGNGFNEADDTGTSTSRAYCLSSGTCTADLNGLVTTFTSTDAVPEPGTFGLLGGALLGVGFLRKRFTKS
jgi:PEP-CTERM motif